MFSRVYIEITNFCGLNCKFCEPKKNAKAVMDLALFEKIHMDIQGRTKELSYHLLGDPLSVPNLDEYLDISQKYGFNASLTTSGFYMDEQQSISTLFHPAVKQINISLSSFFANQTNISFEEYMYRVCTFAKQSSLTPKRFVNLRLWNYGDDKYSGFNSDVFAYLSSFFDTKLEQEKDKINLASYVRIVKDVMFEWPSVDKPTKHTNGTCHALSAQLGFLCNGDIVPCCLDAKGDMKLGNIKQVSIQEALNSERALNMKNGFKNNVLTEPMCQTCGFRELKL
jgi:radical SAM protein with 4Fe4S-binding SPASM domain